MVDVGRDFITVALRDEPGEALRQRLMEDASAGRGWRIDEDLDDKMHGQLRRTIKALGCVLKTCGSHGIASCSALANECVRLTESLSSVI